jgi:hypothetical protein
MNFKSAERYLERIQSIFKVLVNSGSFQDQIDRLDFEILHVEYLEVANRHSECVERINAVVNDNRPHGMSDAQQKQWEGSLSRLYYLLGQEHRQFGRLELAQRATRRVGVEAWTGMGTAQTWRYLQRIQ